MARIRTIKPEFFTSEDIVELEPRARLLYIALWCEADKEGRLAWKPRTFKMRYLPGDDCDIDALCDALVTRGLLVLYGDGYAYIPSFKSHQHINPREKDSDLPIPTNETELNRYNISRVSDASARVDAPSVARREEGRERKGKEGTYSRSIPTEPAPENSRFDELWQAYPRRDGPNPRKPAEQKFNALVKTGVDPGLIIEAAKKLAADEASRGNIGTRFIPQIMTWLNQQRWIDHAAVSFVAEPELNIEDQVQRFAKGLPWSVKWYGPEPGHAGCRASPELLAKHGLLADGRSVERAS